MVDDPADFDMAFRRAAAGASPAAGVAVRMKVEAFCARHPETRMVPADEAGLPAGFRDRHPTLAAMLAVTPGRPRRPGEQLVTVTCPEGCGTTVVLSLRRAAGEEES